MSQRQLKSVRQDKSYKTCVAKQLVKESSSHEPQTCNQPYSLSQELDPSGDPAHPHHD